MRLRGFYQKFPWLNSLAPMAFGSHQDMGGREVCSDAYRSLVVGRETNFSRRLPREGFLVAVPGWLEVCLIRCSKQLGHPGGPRASTRGIYRPGNQRRG